MNVEIGLHWDDSPVLMPTRTRLYRLEPIGLGTPMVECLSSYIHRLAEAHGLPTWILVCKELAPRFGQWSLLASNGHCDLFGELGMTINGNNETALEFTAILKHLTGHSDLSSLTFCRLGALVAAGRILRKTQAWCPECLEHRRGHSMPVYQPLIWMLSSLKACPIHGCPIEERCSKCGKSHAPIGRYRWNGQCPKCSSWLGHSSSNDKPAGKTSVSIWCKFTAKALAQFMLDLQSLPEGVPQATFPSNVMDLVQNRFGGNYSALARTLQVHRMTVFAWANGKQRPSPVSLVALAYCLGGEAMDWVARRIEPATLHATRSIDESVAQTVRRPLRRFTTESVRAHLTSVLQAAEFPPRSFAAVCRQFGVNQTVAKRRCPDLAEQFMSLYRVYQTEGKRTREKFRRIVIESAVNQLLIDGRTLSYNQLSKVLPPRMSARDRLVRLEFKRLRKEAEEEMQTVMQEPIGSPTKTEVKS
jgi:hypothetical protein